MTNLEEKLVLLEREVRKVILERERVERRANRDKWAAVALVASPVLLVLLVLLAKTILLD